MNHPRQRGVYDLTTAIQHGSSSVMAVLQVPLRKTRLVLRSAALERLSVGLGRTEEISPHGGVVALR